METQVAVCAARAYGDPALRSLAKSFFWPHFFKAEFHFSSGELPDKFASDPPIRVERTL